MNRRWKIALLAVLAATLVVGGLAWAENDDWGPGWGRGPGMMWGGGDGYGRGMMGRGYGPGMMGGGMGMMGFGMGPVISQLPADKQEQLRKVHVNATQAMVPLMADMQAKMDALRDATRKFPLDQAAAKKTHEAMGKVREQMFALHLATLAQAQQVVGKEAWDELQEYGDGYGYGRGRGPGMMGPGARGPNR